MIQMTLDMPEEALAALRKGPQDFARELRLAAAVKWYELKLLSQERASRVAGLSRAARVAKPKTMSRPPSTRKSAFTDPERLSWSGKPHDRSKGPGDSRTPIPIAVRKAPIQSA